MTPAQKTWIATRTIPQLIEGFNKLLLQGKTTPAEWVEWCKVWSANNGGYRVEDGARNAYEVFKESE